MNDLLSSVFGVIAGAALSIYAICFAAMPVVVSLSCIKYLFN